jgi:prophage DNA circulation protein
MSDWRPASFRGVPFKVMDKPEYTLGHTVVEHKIFDGEGFTEDTGDELDTFSLAAAVMGQDYLAQGKKLEAAFRVRGPGVLVHPTKGRLMVQIGTVAASVVYQRIDYKIECKESGYPLPPEVIPDMSAMKWTAALRASINGAFVAVFSVVDKATGVAAAAINDINDAASAVNDAAKKFASPDIFGNILQAVEDLAATVDQTVRIPSQLAGQWGELLAPMARAGRQACLQAIVAVGPAQRVSGGSVIDSNRDALADLVRGGLAAVLCDALVLDLPPTREAALLALSDVSAMVTTVASETIDRDVWRATMDARDATVRLTQRLILRLPQTRVWTPPQALSVFEASASLFGDGAQVDDILARNAIACPLWIADPIRVRVGA